MSADPPKNADDLGRADTGSSDEDDDSLDDRTASAEGGAEERPAGSERCGTMIAGKYRLVAVLGAGGMGTVYEARHAFTNRRVAVKLLHASLALSGKAALRFVREARAPASIGHPGIIEILDGGREPDGTLYIIEELLDGEDLHRVFSKALPSTVELLRVIIQILDALEAAHSRGFVHRDVKPENIFILRQEHGITRAKLLDFGVAKRLDSGTPTPELTAAGTVIGTAWYMSPEQARGEVIDGRADLWAIGAVLFHGLAGRRPIDGDNYNLMIARLITESAPSLAQARPDLPAELIAIVDRALQPDLAKRWPSAAEMRNALRVVERQLEATPVITPASSPAEIAVPEASASIPPVLDPRGGTLPSQSPSTPSDRAPTVASPTRSRAFMALAVGLVIVAAGSVVLLGRGASHMDAPAPVPPMQASVVGSVISASALPIAADPPRIASDDPHTAPDVVALLPSVAANLAPIARPRGLTPPRMLTAATPAQRTSTRPASPDASAPVAVVTVAPRPLTPGEPVRDFNWTPPPATPRD